MQQDSNVTCFSLAKETTGTGNALLIYGCKNGRMGAIELTKDEAIVLWENEVHGKSSISHIKADSLGDQNIVLARDSGDIEVYTYTVT